MKLPKGESSIWSVISTYYAELSAAALIFKNYKYLKCFRLGEIFIFNFHLVEFYF